METIWRQMKGFTRRSRFSVRSNRRKEDLDGELNRQLKDVVKNLDASDASRQVCYASA